MKSTMRKSSQRNVGADESKKKRNIIIISLFVIAIMFFSIIGFAFMNNANGFAPTASAVTEAGYRFSINSQDNIQTWQTTIKGKKYDFFVLPSQVSYFTIDEQTRVAIRSAAAAQSMVVTADATSEFSPFYNYGIFSLFVDYSDAKQFVIGNTATSTDDESSVQSAPYPQITCESKQELMNSGLDGGLIIFEIADESTITTEDGCIYVRAIDGQDFIFLLEKLRYSLLGIE